MKITKPAIAGSLESSDAMITLEPCEQGVTIDVDSVVKAQFGAEIERAVREVLLGFDADGVHVWVQDRGAMECVLKARVETALLRAQPEKTALLRAREVDSL